MAVDLVQIALDLLDQYGLAALFVLLVLDGAMLMPVFPGELVMIIAVAQYATTPGDLVGLVLLATAAAVVGSLLLYGICRAGGRRLVESHPRLFLMDRRRRERLERAFERPVGQSLVLFLRLVPLTRALVNIPAGLARMKLGRFLVLSTIGMLAFHAGFMWLAFEYRQPGSGVALQAAALQEAYANPAWDYVQTNKVVTGLAVLAFGAFLSLRSSRRVLGDPAGAVPSLLGKLAARVLFWGGIAVGVVLAWRPHVLFEVSLAGGLDLERVAKSLGYEAEPLVAMGALVAWLTGAILLGFEKAAKRRAKWAEQYEREVRAEREAHEARAGHLDAGRVGGSGARGEGP